MAYVILVVDYLTKWEEMKAMKVVVNKTTTLYIFENIIAWYEGTRDLTNDRGIHFLNYLIEESITTYGIDLQKINLSNQWPSWTNQQSYCPYFTKHWRKSHMWLRFQA